MTSILRTAALVTLQIARALRSSREARHTPFPKVRLGATTHFRRRQTTTTSPDGTRYVLADWNSMLIGT
ncbi:MAG: hypothetical protein NTY27_05080 [Actinobacteria bacterium]|nr:hypothetical protein [Actinomycetota bacterium]